MRSLAVVALCALALTGCGSGSSAEYASPSATTTEAPEAAGRRPAPAIEGVSLSGERISLAGFRGRPVFVNVWSSW